ncbi:MAG: tripartite tricarboxylate transporter substrate binding protein [Rhodoferax sp.]|jgi:tripartite-type tricarboxylate transporter receptor subunit TctC|nr:tripartite tricarboxylate transporter substrate binding protein [Rhodoferax sp.]
MQIRRSLVLSAVAAAVALTVPLGSAFAQAYPSKQINLVVSFPPGGDTDALARVFAEKLSARVGQPVVVENKTGASGTIGNSFVAKANPDGYTLLFTPNTLATAPLVLKPGTGATYDPLTDFTPIILAGTQSLFVVVNTATGVTNLKDLAAAAKSGKITNYASPGNGSPMHILGEMFNKSAGIKLSSVPYRGSGPAIVDLLGGQLPMMYTTLGPVAQHIASGKLANIGVADARRSPLAPNVPTLAEAGFNDSEVGAWQGLVGPKGMSPDIVRVLNGHMNEILRMPDVVTRMTGLALVPVGGEPAALSRAVSSDFNRYGKIIKETGIQAD